MLSLETKEFLSQQAPFSLLPEGELELLFDDVVLDYFPRGTVILGQGASPADALFVIKKGGIKVSVKVPDEEDLVIDYRSDGDYFGLLSVVTGDPPRADVTAIEDTISYLFPREPLLSAFQRHPEVSEALIKSYFAHFIDRTHEETRNKFSRVTPDDRVLFETPVAEIVRRTAVTARQDLPIREAARSMTENRISSLLILDHDGAPAGVVTDRDLREKVLAAGLDPDQPVGPVMSSPVIGVDAEEPCLEALMTMMQHRVHHLLVTSERALPGIVTSHDFMLLQGSLPTALIRSIAKTGSLEELNAAPTQLVRAASSLLRDGAGAFHVTAFATLLTETLLNRAVDLLERELGPPPVAYSLFVVGGAGRGELLLDERPELGLVYERDGEASEGEPAGYFEKLLRRLEAALSGHRLAIGHPRLVPGSVRSLEQWRRQLRSWSREPAGELPPDFLEMRTVRGEDQEIENLRLVLLESVVSTPDTVAGLKERAFQNRPPLGFFKNFLVDADGQRVERFDVYETGLRPLVDLVRLHAVAGRIPVSSTRARLREMLNRAIFGEAENVEHAWNYLLTFLLHHQLDQLRDGRTPDRVVAVDSLSPIERKTLKDTFQLAARLREDLAGAWDNRLESHRPDGAAEP